MPEDRCLLRVAFVAGALGRGGAEKQLVYMAQSLHDAGVTVRVFCLTSSDCYRAVLDRHGIDTVFVGRRANPLLRLACLRSHLAAYQPHVVQAGQAFTNLYVGLLARGCRAISVGALRNSLPFCRAANGYWTRPLITACDVLAVNSKQAASEVFASRLLERRRIHYLPNAVDLSATEPRDASRDGSADALQYPCTVACVGRLVGVKRFDLFLRALALARRQAPRLEGLVVGDGPEHEALKRLTHALELPDHAVAFLGVRNDVAKLLSRAQILISCSDDEGMPNVLLEAMAAGVPVITRRAGDAALLVDHGRQGLVLKTDDASDLASALVRLATSPLERRQMGEAGRDRVQRDFDLRLLPERLLRMYRVVARQRLNRTVLDAIPRATEVERLHLIPAGHPTWI